jgi:hypothetical protein
MAIWNILQTFGICYDHLVHFVLIWYIFPGFGIMFQEKSGNPGLTRPSPIVWLSLKPYNMYADPFRICHQPETNCHKYFSNQLIRPGGVAQWASHPPQEQQDPGLNPARVQGFQGNIALLLCIQYLNMHCLWFESRNKGIGYKTLI